MFLYPNILTSITKKKKQKISGKKQKKNKKKTKTTRNAVRQQNKRKTDCFLVTVFFFNSHTHTHTHTNTNTRPREKWHIKTHESNKHETPEGPQETNKQQRKKSPAIDSEGWSDNKSNEKRTVDVRPTVLVKVTWKKRWGKR